MEGIRVMTKFTDAQLELHSRDADWIASTLASEYLALRKAVVKALKEVDPWESIRILMRSIYTSND